MKFQSLDFCKFRIPEVGGRVIWEVTNECNYACSYCIFASTGKKPENELTTEKIFETLKDLKKHNFTYIKFTGGEPFLREDMLDILNETKRLGFDCDISTNASRITESIAEALEKLNLKMIHVSLDGHNASIHEAVRGKKSFNPTMNGLKILSSKKLNIRIGCVIHQFNECFLKEMIDFCEELSVNELILSMMEPVGRMRDDKSRIAVKTPLELALHIDTLKEKSKIIVSHNLLSNLSEHSNDNGVCPGGDKFLFINSTGDVSPCTWITERAAQFIFGNLHLVNLTQLLTSSKYSTFRGEVLKLPGKCPANESNVNVLKVIKFSSFSKVYSFSTENLDYLTHINLNNKKVLTVGASLDHHIVCSMLGASSIVNFDINENAHFYAQLKISALSILSYNEFLDFFMRGDKAFSRNIYKKIQILLNRETDLFFQTLYNTYQKGSVLREQHFFNNLFDNKEEKIFNSYYLRSNDNYLQAQKNIKKELNWISTDILDFKNNSNFDIILLSNIADYSHKMFLTKTHVEEFKEKVVDKFYKFLNPNGKIMFAYIFDYNNENKSDKRNILNNNIYRAQVYNKEANYFEINIKSAMQNVSLDSTCFLEKKDDK